MLERKIIYILSVCLLVTFNIYGQTKDTSNNDEKTIVVKKEEKSDKKESKWEYKAEFPELISENGESVYEFNEVSNKIAIDETKAFTKNMSEMTDEDWSRKPKNMLYEMTLGYSVEFLDDNLASIKFGRYEYSGGAHGSSRTITLNYNLKNRKVLELKDLFNVDSNFLEIISKESIRQITIKQEEYADEEWIGKGAGEDIKNFSKWNVTKDGLVFTFDQYQVGPYSAGSFETILPFEKFPYEIRSSLFNSYQSATYVDGSPVNWCRNGFFPSQTAEFKLANLKEKANFLGDDKGCPFGKDCQEKSYVVKNDEVIVGKTYQDYACVWFQPENGSETVGWLQLKSLTIKENNLEKYDWAGKWSFYDNDLTFVPEKTVGDFVVTGNAFWKGVGDNVHIGDIGEQTITPKNGLMKFDGVEEYDCGVKMQRLGKYLIVNDNKHCGGVNVTFDGIYVKKVKIVGDEGADAVCSINDFAEMTYGSEKDLNFRLGSIKTRKNQKAHFMESDGSKVNSYLVQGDQVIVSKTKNKSACVWYQPKKGKETVGWISFENLSFKPSSSIRQDWVGTWEYGEGEIKVIPQKRVGSYKFMGKTFWIGQGEGNVNIGDIDFVASPTASRLTSNGTKDLPECKVKMSLLGNYLIVSDNEQCGGKNVTFFGVYRKK